MTTRNSLITANITSEKPSVASPWLFLGTFRSIRSAVAIYINIGPDLEIQLVAIPAVTSGCPAANANTNVRYQTLAASPRIRTES